MLRAVLAAALLTQGVSSVQIAASLSPSSIAGGLAIAAGASLLAGFFTPVVSAVAIGLSLLPGRTPDLIPAGFSMAFALVMLLALIMLGPGAFSIDARLFGRREIIIPRRSTRQD